MSTDRELLELAAKAAGFEVHAAWQKDRDAAGKGDVGLWLTSGTTCWNPLTDDGQALRLAVKLKMNVCLHTATAHVYADMPNQDVMTDACYRRAITRAAAEIGREMT